MRLNEGYVDVGVEEVLSKVGREGGWNLEVKKEALS